MPKSTAVTSSGASRRTVPARPSGRSDDGADMIEGVRVTHPDRILFAAQGVTKRDLIAHYLSVADAMLPHLANRPISLVRCPRGSGKDCFFQKHGGDGFPDQFKHVRIREKSGAADYLYIEDARGLIAAVQMGVLEFHVWGCHVDAIERPDRMVFDFDPDEDLPFAQVREAAREMRERLSDLKLESFALLTGGKGVHVVVPLTGGHDWRRHRDFAEALARAMAADDPARYVATMAKAKRKGRIFIDYLRNQRGATAIAPWSSRARPGAKVAVPLSWPQLARAQQADPVAVGAAARRPRTDAWPDYFKLTQRLPSLG